VYEFPSFLPKAETEKENKVICLSAIGASKAFSCLATNILPDLHLTGDSQCFPYYFYNEDGRNRRHNITDWALEQFRIHYEDRKIGKWDIFYYVYGLLHHSAYRSTFADCLKRELPRIPFAPEFWAFSKAGKKLAEWHLNYEQVEAFKLKFAYSEGKPLSFLVENKMRLSKDKAALVFNSSLTLQGIPPETFDYRLGNRSALEWVIDQYQVKRDESGEIISDPNRKDDPEYIVRLVGQVIRVSLETVRIVSGLPEKCF
jgi:predicted helicase